MLLVLAVFCQSICVTCQLSEQHVITLQCYTLKSLALALVSLAMPQLQMNLEPQYPVPLYNSAIPLASQTQTIQRAYDDFRSLIYELSSFSLELSRPLTDWSQTAPYRIAFLALQGWRLVMTATFDHLFGDHRNQATAWQLNSTLLRLLPEVWDMASRRSFGPVCSMLMLMVSPPL